MSNNLRSIFDLNHGELAALRAQLETNLDSDDQLRSDVNETYVTSVHDRVSAASTDDLNIPLALHEMDKAVKETKAKKTPQPIKECRLDQSDPMHEGTMSDQQAALIEMAVSPR